ncbi:MAG: PP2C family protein-serine/threonine phosphatase [bacterium]
MNRISSISKTFSERINRPDNRELLIWSCYIRYSVAFISWGMALLLRTWGMAYDLRPIHILFSIIIGANTLTLYNFKRWTAVMPTVYLNLVWDIGAVSISIYFTGGYLSPFTALYLLVIAGTGVIIGLWAMVGVAVLIAGAFASMASLELYGIIPKISPSFQGIAFDSLGYDQKVAYIQGHAAVFLISFIITAYMGGYAANRLRLKEKEVEKKNRDLEINTEKLEAIIDVFDRLQDNFLMASKDRERKQKELEALYVIGKEISAELDLDRLLQLVVEKAVEIIPGAEAGSLALLNGKKEFFEFKAALGFPLEEIQRISLRLNEGFFGVAMRDGRSHIIKNAPPFNEGIYLSDENRRLLRQAVPRESLSAICVPIKIEGEIIGILNVDNFDSIDAFTERDVGIMEALADQASIAIKSAQLFRETQVRMKQIEESNKEFETVMGLLRHTNIELVESKAELERLNRDLIRRQDEMDRELNFAREVQQLFFPSRFGRDWIDMVGYCRPSREIGGDFYSFVDLGEGMVAVLVGDVAGRGVPAALISMAIVSTIRELLRASRGLPEIFEEVNNLIHGSFGKSRRGEYVTAWLGIVDREGQRIDYVNGGHIYPILSTGGDMRCIEEHDLVLGAFPGERYQQYTVPFGEGDRLILYTDGFIEAKDPSGNAYGRARLMDTLRGREGEDVDTVLSAVRDSITAHLNGYEGEDDITAVIVQRLGGHASAK